MNDALYILPEIALTFSGVIVMLADATMPKSADRKPLGWLAALGTLAALAASLWQYQLPPGTAYYGVVQTDAFSVFFHRHHRRHPARLHPHHPRRRHPKLKASASSSPSCNSAPSA